ncbi:low-density lipoprotein receptor-related protein 8-like [Tubulanus polymorphus]|uniref:low-density lipoprotein receptor-related protein 8-like n=1 Tax=Tubulanus polymorphus TaxID=672921 RepID=UPI003DA42B73
MMNKDNKVDAISVKKPVYVIEFVHRLGLICWIDNENLMCRKQRGSSEPVHVKLTRSLKSVEHMAFDWIALNWYFTDSQNKRIFMCHTTSDQLNGRNETAIGFCKVIINQHFRSPKSIVVDPNEGYIFYIDGAERARIDQALLDGSGRRTIVKLNIVRPNGLTLDYANRYIYWLDTYGNHISRIDYHARRRVEITSGYSVSIHSEKLMIQ